MTETAAEQSATWSQKYWYCFYASMELQDTRTVSLPKKQEETTAEVTI